ncbi:hypothetical protein BH11VER1_BH11VER1_01510 [soil metagenome]
MHMLLADIVWPAVLLEGRILTWWSILAGLIVEYFFVRRITDLSFSRAVIADIAMNTASALLGVILIPMAGIIWEFVPGFVLYKVFNFGTFNPASWIATTLMAAAINTFIERFVLRKFFKQPVAGARRFWLLFAGNAISIAIAFGSFIYVPPRY